MTHCNTEELRGDMMTYCNTEDLRDAQESGSTQTENKPQNVWTHCGTAGLGGAHKSRSPQTTTKPVVISLASILAQGPLLEEKPLTMPAADMQIMAKQVTTRQTTSACADEGAASSCGCGSRATGQTSRQTSVILRNLPLDMTRGKLLQLLGGEGFAGTYDLVYLPRDFKSSANLGYAFVNLLKHSEALRMQKHFTGFSRWSSPSFKMCEAAWSRQQGLAAYIDRYRNNPVMHESVPEEFKPILFRDGVQIPFPSPTRRLKMPQE